MAHPHRGHALLFMLMFIAGAVLPTVAFAQAASSTATSTYDSGIWGRWQGGWRGSDSFEGDTDESTERQRIRGWRGDSATREKVNALPAQKIERITIPILLGVEVSDLTRNFGDPRSSGRTHEGLDIMAPKGAPIVSPTQAVVLRIGVGANSGNHVYTANPGGETFVYMHLDQVAAGLTAGMVLSRGDLIGYVGNTGNASGGPAHLHLEIRDGVAQDPFPRLTESFILAEQASILTKLFATSSPPGLAEFLVKQYKLILLQARSAGYPLPTALTALLDVAAPKVSFTRDLSRGMSGPDVQALQVLLNAQGFVVSQTGAGSTGQETTYFGPATQAALVRFQLAKNIFPAAGYFGPITRGVVAAL